MTAAAVTGARQAWRERVLGRPKARVHESGRVDHADPELSRPGTDPGSSDRGRCWWQLVARKSVPVLGGSIPVRLRYVGVEGDGAAVVHVWELPEGVWSPGDRVEIDPLPAGVRLVIGVHRERGTPPVPVDAPD